MEFICMLTALLTFANPISVMALPISMEPQIIHEDVKPPGEIEYKGIIWRCTDMDPVLRCASIPSEKQLADVRSCWIYHFDLDKELLIGWEGKNLDKIKVPELKTCLPIMCPEGVLPKELVMYKELVNPDQPLKEELGRYTAFASVPEPPKGHAVLNPCIKCGLEKQDEHADLPTLKKNVDP